MPNQYRVLIFDKGKYYKILHVSFFPKGGFAVHMPHHRAAEGFLSKFSLDNRFGTQTILSEMTNGYSLGSNAKLSFHQDGRVHFSDVGEGATLWGRDRRTSETTDLGIKVAPLREVVNSGVAFSVSIWGLEDFETVDRPLRDDVVFRRDDCLNGNIDDSSCNGYTIKGLLVDSTNQQFDFKNGQAFGYSFFGQTMQKHRVLVHYGSEVGIGLVPLRGRFSNAGESGFLMVGPRRPASPRFAGLDNELLAAAYPLNGSLLHGALGLEYSLSAS